jgi:hypothetical protein
VKSVGRSGRVGRRIGKSEIKVINEFLNSCWVQKKKRRIVPKIKRNGHFNCPVWSNNSSSLAVPEKFKYCHADELWG